MIARFFLSASAVATEDSHQVSIVLVGDSTVASYSTGSVMHGWGQELPRLMERRARIVNLAVCGASTKTFRESGAWTKALAEHPDFVLIQFGHNDSHPSDTPEGTRADGDYMTNLESFVCEARAAGAIPILVTPMHRRIFSPGGKMSAELRPYANAMKSVAETLNVPVIDLYAMSGELIENLGDDGSSGLTVSAEDRTHFTEEGAQKMAEFVTLGMRHANPTLAGLVLSNA